MSQRHVSPGRIPGWRVRCEKRSQSASLRPALRGVFPSRSTDRLRSRNRRHRGNCNPRRRLRPIDRRRQSRLRHLRHALFLFRKQGSHKPQCLHFLFQPRQLHFLLPQNFINVFHSQGTRTLGRWIEHLLSNFSRIACIVKGFRRSGGARSCTRMVENYRLGCTICASAETGRLLRPQRSALEPTGSTCMSKTRSGKAPYPHSG